ncbi:MAG: CooT family nickel-binding protein [Actinobacteria bacterium]|nr:CooT family nickel-binding protein [Actinomycetota bacterium]
MCEAIVFIVKDGKQEKIMEDVVTVYPEGDKLILTDIFGEQRIISASINKVDLIGHEIFLNP